MLGQHQHDVGLHRVGGEGFCQVQDADARVRLAQPLGQHEPALQTRQARSQFPDAVFGGGEDRDLGESPGEVEGRGQRTAMRADHDGVVPGQCDGCEGAGDRGGRGHHFRVQPP